MNDFEDATPFPRAYDVERDSQTYHCPKCGHDTVDHKLSTTLTCEGCGIWLQKRGYPGRPVRGRD